MDKPSAVSAVASCITTTPMQAPFNGLMARRTLLCICSMLNKLCLLLNWLYEVPSSWCTLEWIYLTTVFNTLWVLLLKQGFPQSHWCFLWMILMFCYVLYVWIHWKVMLPMYNMCKCKSSSTQVSWWRVDCRLYIQLFLNLPYQCRLLAYIWTYVAWIIVVMLLWIISFATYNN
jgi:hypothetical protein